MPDYAEHVRTIGFYRGWRDEDSAQASDSEGRISVLNAVFEQMAEVADFVQTIARINQNVLFDIAPVRHFAFRMMLPVRAACGLRRHPSLL
jgi:hypothetical protein